MHRHHAAAAFALTLVVAACSGDSASTAAASTTAPEVTPPATAPTTAPPDTPLATTTTETPAPPTTIDPVLLHPCRAPEETDVGGWSLQLTELGDLPRTVACGPGGVWVHLYRTDSATFISPTGAIGANYAGVGEPKGNESLVVFHTFTKVSYATSSEASSATSLLDLGDDAFISDAVPFGASQVLVASSTEIALYGLDGDLVWSVPSAEKGEFVFGDDDWWVADTEGQLVRIPLDGSDPVVVGIPDTVYNVAEVRRTPPTIVPVPGGAWITNADGTLQLVGDDGTLGPKINGGKYSGDDGTHVIVPREAVAFGEYLYWTDDDGMQYKLKNDGNSLPEFSRDGFEAPFADGAGLTWFIDRPLEQDGRLSAVDEDGVIVLDYTIPAGQGTRETWASGSLWISDQIGFLVRIGPN